MFREFRAALLRTDTLELLQDIVGMTAIAALLLIGLWLPGLV